MATPTPVLGSWIGPQARFLTLIRRWSAPAWGAIGTTSLFLGITCWWLTQDRSVPIFDAGLHLSFAYEVRHQLAAGHFVKALTLSIPYPPLAYLVGAAGFALGGNSVAAPIIAENFVFVPLLALGCYHVGRMAFSPLAGLLAVIFALGSPLIMAQFHVFMIDAPETAMVAASLWAVLATDNFSRIWISGLAGLAVGLGLLAKEPFAFFIVGPVVVTSIRGGINAWRGITIFVLATLLVALPWYLHEFSTVKTIGLGSIQAAGAKVGGDIAPARYSLDNFTWYFWNILNYQLYLPLFIFSMTGWIWTLVGFVRRRSVSRLAPEIAAGAFVGWLAITLTFTHDTRYSMPLLVYAAVFATGWITKLQGKLRLAVVAALILVALANTLGTTFGLGRAVEYELPGANRSSRQAPGKLTIFVNTGFLVGAPVRNGNLLPVLRALKRSGVNVLVLSLQFQNEADFSGSGLIALAQIAGLEPGDWAGQPLTGLPDQDAVLEHRAIKSGEPPPCVKLSDGSGVWIVLGNPQAPDAEFFCPTRRPQFYG